MMIYHTCTHVIQNHHGSLCQTEPIIFMPKVKKKKSIHSYYVLQWDLNPFFNVDANIGFTLTFHYNLESEKQSPEVYMPLKP